MTLENYFYKNMNVGFGAVWQLMENIIEHCFSGDFDTYGYTKSGKIYNKLENRTICKVNYFVDYDGKSKVYFIDNIMLENEVI